MEDLITQCSKCFEQLFRFSNEILMTRPPVLSAGVDQLERLIGFSLPTDFRFFLDRTNGFSLPSGEVYGLSEQLRGSSLDKVYEYEHDKVDHKMPKNLFPFAPDGRGNHYCLDLEKLADGSCPVRFWQWDYECNVEEIEICNENFVSWVEEVVIGWTLEEYEYDGTRKSV